MTEINVEKMTVFLHHNVVVVSVTDTKDVSGHTITSTRSSELKIGSEKSPKVFGGKSKIYHDHVVSWVSRCKKKKSTYVFDGNFEILHVGIFSL